MGKRDALLVVLGYSRLLWFPVLCAARSRISLRSAIIGQGMDWDRLGLSATLPVVAIGYTRYLSQEYLIRWGCSRPTLRDARREGRFRARREREREAEAAAAERRRETITTPILPTGLRTSVVRPAQRSPAARNKAACKRTHDDLPVHSFDPCSPNSAPSPPTPCASPGTQNTFIQHPEPNPRSETLQRTPWRLTPLVASKQHHIIH